MFKFNQGVPSLYFFLFISLMSLNKILLNIHKYAMNSMLC